MKRTEEKEYRNQREKGNGKKVRNKKKEKKEYIYIKKEENKSVN